MAIGVSLGSDTAFEIPRPGRHVAVRVGLRLQLAVGVVAIRRGVPQRIGGSNPIAPFSDFIILTNAQSKSYHFQNISYLAFLESEASYFGHQS